MSTNDTTRPDLLLEATLALLDGWCGPIVVRRGTTHTPLWIPGVWLGWSDEDAATLNYEAVDPTLENGAAEFRDEVEVYLDLSRRECRDRVARALAVPLWELYASQRAKVHAPKPSPYAPGHLVRWRHDPHGYTVVHWAVSDNDGSWRMRVRFFCLADLDPNDGTRLPDGTRLVDALALLHVARAAFKADWAVDAMRPKPPCSTCGDVGTVPAEQGPPMAQDECPECHGVPPVVL